nr:MAG TPA: 4Fe-4S single cluster domain protein [Caudoviricetes sp.]
MNYFGITKCDIANGLGVRVVLWVSGCTMHCPGCHNPETWEFTGGKIFDDTAKQELFEALSKPWVKGITISGGHPLEPENRGAVYDLLQKIKKEFPDKDIWLYTGYNLDSDDFQDPNIVINQILTMCDVVVDGPFILEQRDLTLPFRGSRNQRLIDVHQTLEKNQICELKI